MKKIILLILVLLMTACGSNTSVKRGSLKTIDEKIEKEVKNEQVKNSKEQQIATMPDVSVFFPETEEENKKYSSSIWGIERKSIYADSKASGIGDIVFVQVKEAADAKIDYSKAKGGYTNYVGEPKETKAEVFVRKSASIRGDYGLLKNPNLTTEEKESLTYERPASDSQNGTASTNSSFAFEGQIAARIIGTDKYGNLFLKGTKTALVNNEIVVLEMSGFVRSQDIKADNTVDSEFIENMEFLYNGALYVRQPIIEKEIGSNADMVVAVPVEETKEKTTVNSTTKK